MPSPSQPVIIDDEPEQPAPPPKDVPKKVAVILGPGGGKTFAHVGVLKAFQQQRIPIDRVVGLEWGSLIAGLFATKGTVHDLEWKLYKMEQQNLPQPKGLFGKQREETVKVMDNYLRESFGGEDIAKSKIEFSCPTRSVWTGMVTWQSRGAFSEAIKRCLPYPPVFKVQGNTIGGASQATEAIDKLVKDGFNVIIFVNVLGSAMPVAQNDLLDNISQVILWQEVKRAVLETNRYNIDVVNVDTSNFPIVRFDAKKDLIALGEKVGASAAAALVSKYRF